MFKVGDRVQAVRDCDRYYKAGCAGTVATAFEGDYLVAFDQVEGVAINCDGSSLWYVSDLVAEVTPTARSNDPATSKGKRKVNKYEQAVLDCLAVMSPDPMYKGATGKQIAKWSGYPLNCVTPRFAPLRRKGLIKVSGLRRDKQIVWVLA